MPQSRAQVEFNTFVGGLITEASPLNFPANASLSEDNFILSRDGTRQRRFGMDYESGFVLQDSGHATATIDEQSVSAHTWGNVADDTSLFFAAIQIGNVLHFLDATQASMSATVLGTITLSGFSGSTTVQTTVLNGDLLVAYGQPSIARISYDTGAGTFAQAAHKIQTRDFFGIEDGLAVNTRPATLSTAHNYNLKNQSWGDDIVMDTGGVGNPIIRTFTKQGFYPSNADIWYEAKNTSDQYDPDNLEKFSWGTTFSSRGHYIIDYDTRSASRDSASGLTTITDTSTNGGVCAVSSFAGRVFYAQRQFQLSGGDDQSPNLNTLIFFSQIVQSVDQISRCYQEADPTSEFDPQLGDADGGFISIPEAKNIWKMIPKVNALLVFAENGVWAIRGDEGGFRATNFQVVKLASVGATNAESVIDAEVNTFFWSEGGIYIVGLDETGLNFRTQNMTESTIQTLYNNLASATKDHAIGRYDAATRRIRWLYNDSAGYDGISFRNKYNRELIFDTVLGAFSTNTIQELASDSPYVAAFVAVPQFISTTFEETVVINNTPVVINAETVVIGQTVRGTGTQETKYLTFVPQTSPAEYDFTVSLFNNTNFLDWETEDSTGVDAAGFLEAGYQNFGDTMRNKSAAWLVTHFNRTEDGFVDTGGGNLEATSPSSCLVSAKWNFADDAVSNEITATAEAYRLHRNYIPANASDPFNYGYSVITTRNKLNGRGRVLVIRFDTSAGKDCQILGWGIDVLGGAAV